MENTVKKNKIKVLFDMSHSAHGTTGIQQDVRYTFETLMANSNIELSLLWYDVKDNFDVFSLRRIEENALLSDSNNTAILLGEFNYTNKYTRFIKLLKNSFKILFQSSFTLLKISRDFNEIFFKKYLSIVLGPENRDKFMKLDIYLGNFCDIIFKIRHGILPASKIDTADFDIVIFQREIPIRISQNSQKVVRFYDMIEVLNIELVGNSEILSKMQLRNIRENLKQNTEFVCISNTVKNELIEYFPECANRSNVVYVPISKTFKPDVNINKLIRTIDLRFSKHVIKIDLLRGIKKTPRRKILKILQNDLKNKGVEFISYVGSIDERKNVKTLVKAFSNVLVNRDPDKPRVVLLLCGGMGWKAHEIIALGNKMLLNGDIIILDNPATAEMANIMSTSKLFVFPSYAEGFGMPPVEAMATGVAVISSDLPVHREIQKNAAWYFNPDSVKELEKLINYLLEDSDPRIKEKIQLGRELASQFSSHSEEWTKYFDYLLSKKMR